MSHIRKYVVNYTRSFPEHRVFQSAKIQQHIKGSFLTQFRIWKAGAMSNWSKNFFVYTSIILTGVYTVVGFYKTDGFTYTNNDYMKTHKQDKTSLKWGVMSTDKSMGKFDTVLNRFENQPGAKMDYA